jgi:CheY-like chemotaxis protein
VLRDRGGFDVTHAAAAADALREARTGHWDLILTDVEMPGMTGLELLGQVRQVAPLLPVVVLTAHPSVDYAVRALRHDADEFLEKPVSPDRLVEVVTGLVAKGRAARAAARQSVLAIGAHPDDVEIGAAGCLLAHRRMGHEVAILTRIAEGDPTIGVISRVVAATQPTVIYTHSLHDVHQDHRNCHRATLVAVRGVGRVYCFQSPSATVNFRPTRFVPIDDQLPGKLEAIDAFASQVEIRGYLERDLIEATARYWSRYCDARYAEPFEVVRESAVAGESEFALARGIARGEGTAGPAAPEVADAR